MERRKIYHARLMYARPFIDSPDFARNGREISGEVRFAEMPRLLDILENPQGDFSYTMQGGKDSQGTYFLDIRVNGQCCLHCQRCLNRMDYLLCLDTRLFLRDQTSLDALGDDDEEFDSILADTQLYVLDLLEEEILLSLPIAPKHELGTCRVIVGENAHGQAKNPFAALAKLKRN